MRDPYLLTRSRICIQQRNEVLPTLWGAQDLITRFWIGKGAGVSVELDPPTSIS